jgi:pyruvate dehydrogenase E1 component alpha subunit
MTLYIDPGQTTKQLPVKAPHKIQQLLTPEGEVVGAIPNLSKEKLISMYRWMVFGRLFSDRMVALQRQGRMGTFAPLKGQEAAAVGLAMPLEPKDWLIASYRENISHMIKGAPPLAIMKQWGGYFADSYPREINAPPFQIVLGAQMLHAVGVAQALKYNKQPYVVVATCGDGATSEGDFSEALNFAGVYKAPVIFVVQNNGWAISTPRSRQTAAEYIADRGIGFGLRSCVVDGNDVLAVYQVVSEAIAQARAGNGPTLIEAITYRLGAHTTADDPTRYRPDEELEIWAGRDPLVRFRKFLLNYNALTEEAEKQLQARVEAEIKAVVEAYEALVPPLFHQQFNVYADMPPQLERQQAQLLQDFEEGVMTGVQSLFCDYSLAKQALRF